MPRLLVLGVAAAMVLAGCRSQDSAPKDQSAAVDHQSVTQSLAGTDPTGDPCDDGEGYRAQYGRRDRGDRGIGILSILDTIVGRRSDTLVMHADSTPSSPVVARYILRSIPEYSWCYRLEVYEPDIADNSLEVGYETAGLPIAALGSRGRWTQVIYGITKEGRPRPRPRPRMGWTLVEGKPVNQVLWPQHFQAMGGFLWADGKTPPDFRDGPRGAPVDLGLAPDPNGNYHFEVQILEARGRWLKAHIRFPSLCVADSVTHEGVVWFRYLTDTGRPAVWYATRGC